MPPIKGVQMHIFPLQDLGTNANLSGAYIKAFDTRKCSTLNALTHECSHCPLRKIRNKNRDAHTFVEILLSSFQ